MLLEARNITKQFGKFTAVDDLSFDVEEGEVFGIAGPNGAGKTTLFNVITGFYHGKGEILYQGRNIAGLPPHAVCHRGIARTFQMPFLFGSLSVRGNVSVGAHFGNRAKSLTEDQEVEKVLEFVGLAGKGDLPAHSLKVYEKNLTILAAALATRPGLLLLDEPVAGLSPVEADEFILLVQRLNRELGITLIVIEHLMRVLVSISRRLLILDNGRQIALGIPGEVVKDGKVKEVYLGADSA